MTKATHDFYNYFKIVIKITDGAEKLVLSLFCFQWKSLFLYVLH